MAPRRLSDTGEHGWIAALLRRLPPNGRGVLLGPGDDAAVLAAPRHPVVVTTDSLVEGVHFRRAWLAPRALGRKAFRVNASDVAAMGGRPWVGVVSVVAPPSLPAAWLDGVMAGLARDARDAGATLVGGNLTHGRDLALGVTLLGTVGGPVVRRSGARPGDVLWVTGTLGDMGWTVRERLAGRPARVPETPRRWLVGERLAPIAHAMIDVSDGLAQDVGHLCRASGVAAEIDLPQIPCGRRCRTALGDGAAAFAVAAGEDYELAFTTPPAAARRLSALAARTGCPITRIGRIVAGRPAVRLLDAAGRPTRLPAGGFDHFRRRG